MTPVVVGISSAIPYTVTPLLGVAVVEEEYYLVTEDGKYIVTEAGEYILATWDMSDVILTTEDGKYLVTESGEWIVYG